MELWIRSQDKLSLIKVDTIQIIEGQIINGTGSNYDVDLGKYKSCKRALEILDEIQKIIQPKMIYQIPEPIETIQDNFYEIKSKLDTKIEYLNIPVVYQMPEN